MAVWEQEFLEELTCYIGFTPEHAATLGALLKVVEPAFDRIVDSFYVAIMQNERARGVFLGGEAQVARQKVHLRSWLSTAFGGVYDAEYLKLRARIGRTHVRIRLEQRYMFAAMNLVRAGLHEALSQSSEWPVERAHDAHTAIDKICDLELAIMLETYAEDYMQSMRERERLATLGQIAGFIGHELRNPLAVMETSLHLLEKRLATDDEHVKRHLGRVRDQVEVSSSIITDLLELARDRPLQRKRVHLRELIDQALAHVRLHGTLVTTDVALVNSQGAVDSVWLDEVQARLLITNLVSNAAQALARKSDGEGHIAIRATCEGDVLALSVEDNGPGIAEEVRHRLFEPLATARSEGLGLGLALCKRIVEKHGGEIIAENRASGGARFGLRLPQAIGSEHG